MTNLFTRFKYQLQADLHDFFDKKESKNPIALLNQYIRQAEQQTEQTGKLLARQGQLKKELEAQLKETETMLAKREQQLQLATISGEEDLIIFAQAEVEAYTARKMGLLSSIDVCTAEYFELERKFETMKHKIKDMKVRQLQLMGKENVVRAHHQMDKVLHNQDTSNFEELSSYFDNIATKIDHKYEVTTFESRLAKLEKEQKLITTNEEPQNHAIVE
ncbi:MULTISPECIES: PspA/IM30 family protein [Bacillales]|uniref:PspA/IM30 family protein n=1 Tax=Lysinibacillus louembei TaxID=1470088 RepID=A0ABZ0RXT1_9BACI|nr:MULTISPECIES: PspA/IM30 family protein [Bacillales]MCT6923663.1 PspA/IM30 family protein [Metasolibacillus sp.]MCT6939614.1 PspA/IM30 family protein [Metasolibacillus sp.]WPK11841.1 PspA/IM30 family protein [Lysinibacillus louembei]